MLPRQSAVLRPCNNGLEENRGEACKPKSEKDKGLKKAIADLSTWTWTLRGMEEVRPKQPSWEITMEGISLKPASVVCVSVSFFTF